MDLSLSYSDSLAMFQLMQFVTGGKLDTKTHFFDIPPPKKEEKKSRRKRLKEESEVRFWNCSILLPYFLFAVNNTTFVFAIDY